MLITIYSGLVVIVAFTNLPLLNRELKKQQKRLQDSDEMENITPINQSEINSLLTTLFGDTSMEKKYYNSWKKSNWRKDN